LFPRWFPATLSLVPTARPFWKHPTLIVAIICMLVFFAVMFFTSRGGGRNRGLESKSLFNARQLCLVCRQYSREHGGNFPPTFDALFPKYIQDRAVLASPISPGDPVGYTYTPPSPEKIDSRATIVSEDKFSPTLYHDRIVAYANASARLLPIP
jgi:hypothetical protein